MKILYLHQYFCTPSMPGGTRSYEFARRLVNAGHEVHLITSDMSPRPDAPPGWRETTEAGVQVHWLPVPYSNQLAYSQRMRAFLRFAWHSAARAARVGGDIVFASSTPLTIAMPGLHAARRLQVPMVFEVRDLWPEAAIAIGALRNPLLIGAARWLERLAYRHSAHIVALSPRLRDGILRHGVPAEKVSVIPNGCDFDLFQVPASQGQAFRRQQNWLQDRPLVVYTGTLGKVNGVDYLVRVAEQVRHRNPQICFAIAGSGSEESRLRQLAAQVGILDRSFFLLGRLPKLEIPQLLSAANLAVSLCVPSPELALDSANKVFDAIAAGRPVALNYGGHLTDVLRQHQIGIYLPPQDEVAAAGEIVRAVTDEHWLARAGEAAVRIGRQWYDRDRLAGQLERILLNAVGRNSGEYAPLSRAA